MVLRKRRTTPSEWNDTANHDRKPGIPDLVFRLATMILMGRGELDYVESHL
jgi:hypothetical protein